MKRKSYIRDNFLRMFILLELMVIALGVLIFSYSKKVVGTEIIDLNQAILKQSAKKTAWALNDARLLCENLAGSSKIIDWVAQGGTDMEVMEYLHQQITDEIWINSRRGMVSRVYLFGTDALYYASDKDKLELSMILSQFKDTGNDLIAENGPWQLGAVRDEGVYGIYRYSFQILQKIKDLVTGEFYGYILVNISEKTLYETYSDLRTPDKHYVLIDEQGMIISSRDKREIGTAFYADFIQHSPPEDSGYRLASCCGKEPLYLYQRVEGSRWYLAERMNMSSVWVSLDRTKWFIAAMVILFSCLVLPVAYLSLKRIAGPVHDIKEKMAQVAGGDLDIRVEEKSNGEFGEIADSFNYMVGRISGLVNQVKEVEKKKRLIEIDFLQEQINPHFIYNTLTSIRCNVEMNRNGEAEEMLINFSKILRKILSRSDEFIPLREELDTIYSYINLQKARYKDDFTIHYDIHPDTLDCLVSNFVLQPIIENAIFYSISESKKSRIELSAYIEQSTLCLKVSDNGIGMSAEQVSHVLQKDLNMNKVGLKNVHERLQLYYGTGYGVQIHSESGAGTDVFLRMPVHREAGASV